MSYNKINILVSFDEDYIQPFQTMIKSLIYNNPEENFQIWLLHSKIPLDLLEKLDKFCMSQLVDFNSVRVNPDLFKNARVSKQYPEEMYYRLLAPVLLPDELERVIYLDPDTLVLNSLRPLWETDLGENVFAGASHGGVTDMVNDVNRIRLGVDHDYYNTGVLLMDLKKGREIVKKEEIFEAVRKYKKGLILPDQDVFNFLYGKQTLSLDDAIWNYDVRYYYNYLIKSKGTYNLDWIIDHTAILHFCGKSKPWSPSYSSRFGALYKHYMKNI